MLAIDPTADTLPAPAPDVDPVVYRLEVRRDGAWSAVGGQHTFPSTTAAMAVLDGVVLATKPSAVRLVRSDDAIVFCAYFAGDR